MLKSKELQNQTVDELEATFQDLRKEHFHLINEFQVNKKLDKPHRLREVRRDKARLLTVLNEKKSQQKNK
ncbi:MAG: 50S ribosomal protein L29 [Chlamydiales bacterium]|nr:50S ribosomal protein L29 [Chlamydiales bacterium]